MIDFMIWDFFLVKLTFHCSDTLLCVILLLFQCSFKQQSMSGYRTFLLLILIYSCFYNCIRDICAWTWILWFYEKQLLICATDLFYERLYSISADLFILAIYQCSWNTDSFSCANILDFCLDFRAWNAMEMCVCSISCNCLQKYIEMSSLDWENEAQSECGGTNYSVTT